MKLTRRDLLLGISGSAAGLVFTPAPWKLLDDVSIRTQRRRSLPTPSRGPVTHRAAACTLCPGGCALRVRCVGRRPVSIAPAVGHPLGTQACALGLTLHHLAYHPLRLTGPTRRTREGLAPVTLEAAVARVAAAAAAAGRAGESVLVLDRRPGRAVSLAWREWLGALPMGVYATTAGEDATLAALAGANDTPFGLDLERTRTLLSFGAPVLDGWGRPGRIPAARGRLRLLQVDAWRSPSASLADEWIAIEPGTEGPLALGLARLVADAAPGRLSRETLDAIAPFTPEHVAARTGVESGARLVSLARELAAGTPAVAIGGGDPGGGPLGRDAERAIAILNVALGSVGTVGGLVARLALPLPPGRDVVPVTRLEDVPGGSVRLALLDSGDDGRAVPWAAIGRTLAPDALVVDLSPFDGPLARQAGLVVPGPAPLEALDEVLPATDDAAASYAIAPALLPRVSEGVVDPIDLVRILATATSVRVSDEALETRLEARTAALYASGRGRFLTRDDGGWKDAMPADARAAWRVLADGGAWLDAPAPSPPRACRALLPSGEALRRWTAPATAGDGLALVAFAARGTAGSTPASPILTKLYQETTLRPSTDVAAVHPRTAATLGLGDGQRVVVESAAGAAPAALKLDPSLPPGRVAVAAGPGRAALRPGTAPRADGALAVAQLDSGGTWRGTRVRVREA